VTFGVLPLWLSVHALVDVWRKFGRGPTAIAHVGLASALCSQFFVPATRVHVMNAFGGDLGFPTRLALLSSFILAALSTLLKAGPCTSTLVPSQAQALPAALPLKALAAAALAALVTQTLLHIAPWIVRGSLPTNLTTLTPRRTLTSNNNSRTTPGHPSSWQGDFASARPWLAVRWQREMNLLTAVGWRGELEAGGTGGKLLTRGVYSVVRHPRYAQIMARSLSSLHNENLPMTHRKTSSSSYYFGSETSETSSSSYYFGSETSSDEHIARPVPNAAVLPGRCQMRRC
jgi:hypothetical protein